MEGSSSLLGQVSGQVLSLIHVHQGGVAYTEVASPLASTKAGATVAMDFMITLFQVHFGVGANVEIKRLVWSFSMRFP